MALDLLPVDVLKLVVAYCEQPQPLWQACRAFASLRHDPHAMSMCLVQQRGSDALTSLSRISSHSTWPLPMLRQTVRFILDLGRSNACPCPCSMHLLAWAAMQLGDAATLQLLLQHSSPPVQPRLLGGQLLTDTCAAGSPCVVAVLLASGAQPRPGDCGALKAASERGHLAVVQLLLAWGRVDPRADSDCALRMAAKNGHAAVISALAAAGCDPRARQDEALSLAVAGGHVEAVRALLQAGASAQARPGLLVLSIGAGAGVVAPDPMPAPKPCSQELTGDCAAAPAMPSAAPSSDEPASALGGGGGASGGAMLCLLWEAGARDEAGQALCMAAAMGQSATVDQLVSLLRRGVAEAAAGGAAPRMWPDAYSRQALTAGLHAALTHGHISIARQLLESGAGVDALLLAASQPMADRRAALELLSCFPRVTLCPPLGGRQLDELLAGSAAEAEDGFARLLINWGADPTANDCQALRRAVQLGRLACVRVIVQAAGLQALRVKMPCCVMRVAIQSAHTQVVSELVGAGLWPGTSDSHHCCADPSVCPARMLCVASCPDTAALLLRSGGAAHAGTALRLVACGKAPSWRSEAVVAAVMDAMVLHGMRQLAEQRRRSLGEWGEGQGREEGSCCHDLDEDMGMVQLSKAAAPAAEGLHGEEGLFGKEGPFGQQGLFGQEGLLGQPVVRV